MIWPLTDLSLSNEVKAILTSLFLLSDISPLIPIVHTQIVAHTHGNTHRYRHTHMQIE